LIGDRHQDQRPGQRQLGTHASTSARSNAFADAAPEPARKLADLLRLVMEMIAQVLLEVVAHAEISSDPVRSRSRRNAVFSRDFMVSTGTLSAFAVSSTLRSW